MIARSRDRRRVDARLMRRRWPVFLLALSLGIFAFACDSGEEPGQRVNLRESPDARSVLKLFAEFQGRLKPELKAAIAEGGTAGAIGRCHSVSPELAALLSREFAADRNRSFTVRRVSDRPRNPDHAPDKFEARVIAEWQAELKAGREIEAVAHQTSQGLRVMQPIRAGAVCLACHGAPETIETETRARLKELYPDDSATGYRAGDLRGAFSAVLGP